MSENIPCPKCRMFNNPRHEKCWNCKSPLTQNPDLVVEESAKNLQQASIDADFEEKIKNIKLTTSYQLANKVITDELDIITAEVVYGMNIFKDIFTAVRDVVGGRSASVQNVLKDSRKEVLLELRKEALLIGADAVISVDLDYQALSDGMVILVASGTAVIVENNSE